MYWTLCIEIQFYASFAALMFIATRLRARFPPALSFFVVVVPALFVANAWALRVSPFDVPGLFLGHWHLFLLGVLVWWAGVGASNDRAALLLVLAELGILASAVIALNDSAMGVGVTAAALILLAAKCDGLTTWLSARPLQWLGAISYSLYLVHNPIAGASFRVASRLTGDGAAAQVIQLVVVTAACVGSASLFYLTIERPSLALCRRVPLRPPPRTDSDSRRGPARSSEASPARTLGP